MKMKIQPTNLTEPLTAGNLLYDLVQMQQQLTQLAQVTVSAVPKEEPDISDGEEGETL